MQALPDESALEMLPGVQTLKAGIAALKKEAADFAFEEVPFELTLFPATSLNICCEERQSSATHICPRHIGVPSVVMLL